MCSPATDAGMSAVNRQRRGDVVRSTTGSAGTPSNLKDDPADELAGDPQEVDPGQDSEAAIGEARALIEIDSY